VTEQKPLKAEAILAYMDPSREVTEAVFKVLKADKSNQVRNKSYFADSLRLRIRVKVLLGLQDTAAHMVFSYVWSIHMSGLF